MMTPSGVRSSWEASARKLVFQLVGRAQVVIGILQSLDQPGVMDGDGCLRSDHCQDIGIAFVEVPSAFVQGLQHTGWLVLDAHRHAQQVLHFEINMLRYLQVMARIVLDVRQADDLVFAEDCPGQAVFQRYGGFGQPLWVRPGGGGKDQAGPFLIVQQDRDRFAIQNFGCGADDELEQLIQVEGRVERDADLDQTGQLFCHVTEIGFGIGHIHLY